MKKNPKLQTTAIHCRAPSQLVKELDAMALKIGAGKTRAQVVRDALQNYVAEERTLSRLEAQHAMTLAAISRVADRSEEAEGNINDALSAIFEFLKERGV